MKFKTLYSRYSDSDSIKMQGSFDDMNPNPNFSEEGLMTPQLDALELKIDDAKIVEIINDFETKYDKFYEETYDLSNRRKRNKLYLFGRQIRQKEEEKSLKDYESRFQQNVLYEIMGTVKPLAMSRLPDLMATPGNNSEEAVLIAQEVTKILDTEIKEEQNRFVLGLAYKHLPVYFTSIIKGWWDNEIDDYRFGVIHPELIKFDWTCSTHNADDMWIVDQKVPATIKTVTLRFPKAKEAFLKQLENDGIKPKDKEPWNVMATTIKYSEVWFDTYETDPNDGTKVRKVSALVWKYKDVILGKMKNPNFDYEGETRYFSYDETGNEVTKKPLKEEELIEILTTGQLPSNVKKEQVYHNYFDKPRKPFYFFGYEQWGEQPLDETSWIEQNLQPQKSLDKRGKQIEETLDSRGHHIFSKSALTPADVEELDLDAPNVDLSVEGKVNEVHGYIPPERPTPEEFREKQDIKESMYDTAHARATRGQIVGNAPATSNQIAREGDFTSADDVVAETINPAAQWMGEWAMQFVKLRYTKDHFRWLVGVAGDVIYQRLNRNMILEGMIVKIKASGTDKLKAQNNAMEMAKMQMTDPYTFFVDMGLSDPEGRTEKLILSKTDPVAYLQKVVKGLDTSKALAQALINAEMPQPDVQPPTAAGVQSGNPVLMAGGQPQGVTPQTQQPSPQNTAQIPSTPPAGPTPASPRVM